MGKGDMNRYGFRCPGCGEWLHVDSDKAYGVAKIALWGFVLALFVTAFGGLSVRWIIFWTVGVSFGISVVGGAVGGWFFPKLSRGVVPKGKVSLSILPRDDPPKDNNPPE